MSKMTGTARHTFTAGTIEHAALAIEQRATIVDAALGVCAAERNWELVRRRESRKGWGRANEAMSGHSKPQGNALRREQEVVRGVSAFRV